MADDGSPDDREGRPQTAPEPKEAETRPHSPLRPQRQSPILRPYTAGLVDISEQGGLEGPRQSNQQSNAGPAGPSGRAGGGFRRPSTSPSPGQSKGGSAGGLSRMRRKDYQDLKELATYGKTLKPLDRKRMASAKPGSAGGGDSMGAENFEEPQKRGGERRGESKKSQTLGHGRAGQPPSSAYPEVEPPPTIMMQRALSPPKYTIARRARPHTTGSMRTKFLGGGSLGDNMKLAGARPNTGVARGRGGASGKGDEVWVDEDGNVMLGGKTGGRYVGEMAGGLPEGRGQHWVPEASGGGMRLLYEGEWMLGVKMGQGTIYYRSGQTYTGDVVDGDRHGVGRLTYSSGDVYHGAWFHGRKAGYGIQFYADSTIYAGKWGNDCREGMATFYWPNRGKKYTGEWVKNVPVCGSVESIRAGEIEKLQYPAPQRPFAARSENLDLPPLEVLQPGLSVYEKVTAVRGARTARGPKPPLSAAKDKSHAACLRPFQIEALKHAYVSIAGGIREEHRLRTAKLTDVCLTAGYHPDSKEMKAVRKCLVDKAHGAGTLSFDAFLEAILWLQM